MLNHYIHCRLFPGGAANVLTDLIREYGYSKETKIFTIFSATKTRDVDGIAIPVISALPRRLQSVFLFFQKHHIPLLSWLFDYRNLIFLYPQLITRLRHKIQKEKGDHLVISSFAVAKNIVPAHGDWQPKITLYLHSPMQYIHTHRNEYNTKITGIKGWIFQSITKKLKKRDNQPRHYNTIIANSNYTAIQAKRIYNITVDSVQYPVIDKQFGQQAPILKPDNYFVYVGRLVKFVKEVDKLIELVNATGDHLVLIGAGPDEAYLKKIAGPTCLFIGRINDADEKMDIIRKSRGLLNITKESFGIVTAEALLCGVPVFGYDDGATPELINKESGILTSDKSIDGIHEAFEIFKRKQWDRGKIWEKAKKKFNNHNKSNSHIIHITD